MISYTQIYIHITHTQEREGERGGGKKGSVEGEEDRLRERGSRVVKEREGEKGKKERNEE